MALEELQHRRAEIFDAARRWRAVRVRVFGSVARGEARPDSDIDFLVDFEPEATLIDQVGLVQDLQTLLGGHVDVISSGGLGPRHDSIRREAVDL